MANSNGTVSVIIPVFNEASTLSQVLDQVLSAVTDLLEVVVVDDCSTDKTAEICTEYASNHPIVHYFRLPYNQGKTAALEHGFAHSIGEIVIVQDADLEYDPREIDQVLKPLRDGTADVALGSRFLNKDADRHFHLSTFLANRLITCFSNLLNGLRLTDVETCYKGFRGELIRSLPIRSRRFGFEVEIIAHIAKRKQRIVEIPISYNGRTYLEGKKIGVRDGLMALWYVFYYNLLEK
jgi:glycosyltransferase involved in cell wall biosynthesis